MRALIHRPETDGVMVGKNARAPVRGFAGDWLGTESDSATPVGAGRTDQRAEAEQERLKLPEPGRTVGRFGRSWPAWVSRRRESSIWNSPPRPGP